MKYKKTEKLKTEKDILDYISAEIVKKFQTNASKIFAGNELLNVLGMDNLHQNPLEVCQRRVFISEVLGYELVTIRLNFQSPVNLKRLKPNIQMVVSELLPIGLSNNISVYLDFVFTDKGYLIGIIPVPLIIDDEVKLLKELKKHNNKALMSKFDMSYYDCCDLWLDLSLIQQNYSHRKNYLKRYKSKKKIFQNLLTGYMKNIYGINFNEIKRYDKTVFVYEHITRNGWNFKHLSLDSLESNLNENKYAEIFRNGHIFISLPGTYVPGKYIDLGYYNAIGGESFGLNDDDIVFVIGFGAGIDLIHSLRKVKRAIGIEINPFAIASARVNLKIAGTFEKSTIIWGDMREIVEGKINLPLDCQDKITKLIWNIPYESKNTKRNPLTLKEFFDNYSVLEWFAPYLANEKLFAENWCALIWKVLDYEETLEEYFSKYGLNTISNNEENICIIKPKHSNY